MKSTISLLLFALAFASMHVSSKDHSVTVGGVTDSGGYYGGGTMDVLQFQPANLTIQAGDTVTFVNAGGSHNVVSDTPGLFRCANGCDGSGGNGNPAAGWTVTIPFNTAGTFGYHCQLHQSMGMSGVITVNPAPQTAFVMTPGITGSWYNPAQSGHGFNVEVAQEGGLFILYWYLFDNNGNNFWLYGVTPMPASSNTVTVPLSQTAGGVYPPLDKSTIQRADWGSLTLTFSDCSNGTASWTPSVGGFSLGSMPITRVTHISGLACP